MRSALALAVTLVAVLAAPSLAAQPLAPFPAPGADACTAHAGTRVCREARITPEGDRETTLRVRRPGASDAAWPVSDSPQAGPFDAVGLPGGLLVAHRETVSNGLGVATWSLRVLPEGAAAPAYSFSARDYGRGGASFGMWRGAPVLWATEWVTSPDPWGRRGEGYYLVGRPFTLGPDGLRPVADLPVRARRLLSDFRQTGGPVAWLSSRRAESRRTDPVLAGCRSRSETVSVARVSPRRHRVHGAYSMLHLASADSVAVGIAEGALGSAALTHLGDAESGRLFPPDYRPAAFGAWLAGREGRIETCSREGRARARVLWL